MASKAQTARRRGKRDAATHRTYDPALAVGIVLLGCLLSFYVVGLPLIAVGAWMWARRRRID